jgi:hypothetical protein
MTPLVEHILIGITVVAIIIVIVLIIVVATKKCKSCVRCSTCINPNIPTGLALYPDSSISLPKLLADLPNIQTHLQQDVNCVQSNLSCAGLIPYMCSATGYKEYCTNTPNDPICTTPSQQNQVTREVYGLKCVDYLA